MSDREVLDLYEEIFGAFRNEAMIFFLLGLAVFVAFFIIRGVGLYKMSRKLDIKKAGLGFVPVISAFQIGRIAQRYRKRDGSTTSALAPVLLILSLITAVLVFVLWILGFILLVKIGSAALQASREGVQLTLDMFPSMGAFTGVFVVTMLSITVRSAFYYVSLWRTFALFDYRNATAYLILSVIFSALSSVFIFLVSQNPAKITFEERIGTETSESIKETDE